MTNPNSQLFLAAAATCQTYGFPMPEKSPTSIVVTIPVRGATDPIRLELPHDLDLTMLPDTRAQLRSHASSIRPEALTPIMEFFKALESYFLIPSSPIAH